MTETPKDRAALVELMANAFAEDVVDSPPRNLQPLIDAMEAALRAAEDVGVVPVRATVTYEMVCAAWAAFDPNTRDMSEAIEAANKAGPYRRRTDDGL